MWNRGTKLHFHVLTLDILANLSAEYNVAKCTLIGDAISYLAGYKEASRSNFYWSVCMDNLQYLVTDSFEKKWSSLKVPDNKIGIFVDLRLNLQCDEADLFLLALYRFNMYVMEYKKISDGRHLYYLNSAKKYAEKFCNLVDERLSNV